MLSKHFGFLIPQDTIIYLIVVQFTVLIAKWLLEYFKNKPLKKDYFRPLRILLKRPFTWAVPKCAVLGLGASQVRPLWAQYGGQSRCGPSLPVGVLVSMAQRPLCPQHPSEGEA